MSEQQNGSRGRRRGRSLSAEEKLQIWQQLLTGELSQGPGGRALAGGSDDERVIRRVKRVSPVCSARRPLSLWCQHACR